MKTSGQRLRADIVELQVWVVFRADPARTAVEPRITNSAAIRPLEPRQHLVAEVRQFVGVVDERYGNAGETGGTQVDELPRHVIGIADDRQTAVAVGELAALRGELFGRHGLRGDIAHHEA